jgi:peptidoglycan/LPS O-acetylase OafA/YrhL
MTLERAAEDRLYEIDLLRFIAALSVVLFHWTFRGAAADSLTAFSVPALGQAWRYGYLGVHLFFLISGFVILMTVSHGGRGGLWRFVVSRVTRLYPAYWFCCSFTALAIWAAGDPRFDIGWSRWLANMTMFNGFFDVPFVDSAYWSLQVEMRFYLMVALVLVIGWLRHAQWLLWGWVAVTALFVAGVHGGRVEGWLIAPYAALFCGGAGCFLIHERGASASRIGLVAAACAVAMVAAARESRLLGAHYGVALSLPVVLAIIGLAFAVMLAVGLGAMRWLRWKGWVPVGALTYPLYLLHQQLGYLAFNRWAAGHDPWLVLVVALVAVIALAWGVHRCVERPLAARLKKGLRALAELRPPRGAQLRP